MALPPDILAAAFREDAPVPDADAAIRAIQPVADALRATLEDIREVDLVLATPDERARVVRLRQMLHAVARDTSTWVDAIDHSFRTAAIRLGAKQIPVGDAGIVKVEPARGEWKVDVPTLRRALEELVASGVVTAIDLEQTFSTTLEEKADNRKLNFLAENRGDEVKAVIDAHRTFHEANPMSARISFLKPSPSDR